MISWKTCQFERGFRPGVRRRPNAVTLSKDWTSRNLRWAAAVEGSSHPSPSADASNNFHRDCSADPFRSLEPYPKKLGPPSGGPVRCYWKL